MGGDYTVQPRPFTSWQRSHRRRSGCSTGSVPAGRRTFPRGRLCPLGEPRVQCRPLAARTAAVAEAADPVHGQVGALPSPLWPILKSGGAFQVRRGEGDEEAIETAVDSRATGRSSRSSRRARGARRARQEARARPHTGAARVALEAEVAADPGRDRGHRPAHAGSPRCGSSTGRRSSWTTSATRMRGRRADRHRSADDRDRRAGERAVKPLLVVDGDSLAHRAYHGLPKTIKRAGGKPSGAIVGFTNLLTRLWESEQPRASSSAGTRSRCRRTGTRRSTRTRAGASSTPRSSSSSTMLPELVRPSGSPRPRRPATRRTTSWRRPSRRRRRGAGPRSSSRPTATLPARVGGVTILTPTRGVSELARIGPEEVRERYGVEPKQVPDFIALRGDPSDKLPGAPGVGPKGAAQILRSTARSRQR